MNKELETLFCAAAEKYIDLLRAIPNDDEAAHLHLASALVLAMTDDPANVTLRDYALAKESAEKVAKGYLYIPNADSSPEPFLAVALTRLVTAVKHFADIVSDPNSYAKAAQCEINLALLAIENAQKRMPH